MSDCERRQIISELAYKLWQEAGEPANMDMHFWLLAEQLLEQTTGSGCRGNERR